MRSAHHRAIVRVRVGRDAHPQSLDRDQQLGTQRLCRCLAHRCHHRQGHAAFTRRTIGRADDVGHGLIQIGIRQDNAVILGPAHALHPLAVGCAAPIDILGDVRRTDKADRLDILVVKNGVDDFLVPMNDVQNARRQPGFERQFGQTHRHRRVTLRRLEDKGIAAGNSRRAHPKRYHRGKVKRGDPGHDAQRLAC